MFPMRSTRTARPVARIHATTRSRARRSSSDRASRVRPPLGVSPMRESSSRVSSSRRRSTFMPIPSARPGQPRIVRHGRARVEPPPPPPRGVVEFGERRVAAAIRETLEETGLEVCLTGLLGVYSYANSPVIVVYRAAVTGGTLATCAENDAVEWVTPAEIPWADLAFPSTRDALSELLAGPGPGPRAADAAAPGRRPSASPARGTSRGSG